MATLAIGFLSGTKLLSALQNSLLGSMRKSSVMMEHLQYLLRSLVEKAVGSSTEQDTGN